MTERRDTETRDGRIQVNDIDVAYTTAGPPDAEPVLLIHGLGSSRHDWRLQVPALARGHCVVAYDVRGHGDTDKPRSRYRMAQLADDAVGLARALGLGPVHVVGLSLGGMIGFQMAVDHPDMVRSLAVVNSGPEVVARSVRDWWRLQLRLFLTWAFGPVAIGHLVGKRLFPRPEQEPLRRAFRDQVASNDRHAYLNMTRAIVGWSVADRLARVTCPVLVVTGDRDYTPVAAKEAYVARLADARLVVVADSGHATPIDQPDALNRELLAFLGGLTREGSTASIAD